MKKIVIGTLIFGSLLASANDDLKEVIASCESGKADKHLCIDTIDNIIDGVVMGDLKGDKFVFADVPAMIPIRCFGEREATYPNRVITPLDFRGLLFKSEKQASVGGRVYTKMVPLVTNDFMDRSRFWHNTPIYTSEYEVTGDPNEPSLNYGASLSLDEGRAVPLREGSTGTNIVKYQGQFFIARSVYEVSGHSYEPARTIRTFNSCIQILDN